MEKVSIKVKVVAFSVIEGKLSIFLPGGKLPAGKITSKSSLNKIAMELVSGIIKEKIEDSFVEQLYTFAYPAEEGLDIDVVYYLLIPSENLNDKFKDYWMDFHKVNKDFFEYSMVSYAVQRLRWKIEYTNVVYSLLPKEFTLTELQGVYEALIGKKIDKRNFRKKIVTLGLLRSTGKKRVGLQARPAKLYEFKKRTPVIVQVFS